MQFSTKTQGRIAVPWHSGKFASSGGARLLAMPRQCAQDSQSVYALY